MNNDTAWDHYYSYELTISPSTSRLSLFARVQMMPVQLCDYSKGHGGFMLCGKLVFEDGTEAEISTDESWVVRRNGCYISPLHYNADILPDAWVSAEVTENIWHTETAPIPIRSEKTLPAEGIFHLSAYEKLEKEVEFDRIYAGFPYVKVQAQGPLTVELECRELQEHPEPLYLTFAGDGEYRGFQLCSTGNILVRLKNNSQSPAKVTVSYIATHYPITESGYTETSDAELNQVLALCRHSLQYCRQTHHLDSPKHCEPLACTGDYYIESLMTLFSFGDMRLVEFDLLRTAYTLEQYNGRMFHTTYSLI